MRVDKVKIKNFRLLQNVEISLENKTTLIVGRNNSGKTSLTELFRRLLSEKSPKFRLEDFSLSVYVEFWEAFKKFQADDKEADIRKALPYIEIRLFIDYKNDKSSYGPLSDFIIDLNPICTDTIINIRYELGKGKLSDLFSDINIDRDVPIENKKTIFFKAVKERISNLYNARIYAEDPNDSTNQKDIEVSKLHTLFQSNFINAQRGLDDVIRKDGSDHKNSNILGNILEQLFTTASNSKIDKDREVIAGIKIALQSIQTDIDDGFNLQLKNLLPTFEMFGYPGLSDPLLCTETTLDTEKLLKNHTKVHYAGINGINLPETYNGLGTRNLIYILLQLLEFYKTFTARNSSSGIHLVFIEEPEAHLHPQMQEVFISKLAEISETFASTIGTNIKWPVQFIVTTHSSHIANKADFSATRYFFTRPSEETENNFRTTEIKDLKKSINNISVPDKEFLHKYMILTRCDLFFADKIILIEGATERIMLPEIIRKIDQSTGKSTCKLSSQYISVMEVGGAYAHKFFSLLQFLQLSTLIITDIDSIDSESKACEVKDGVRTSNACINEWFGKDITPTKLLNKSDSDKIKKRIRISYQVPQNSNAACGRSFEDSFMLSNPSLFDITEQDSKIAYDTAKNLKKTDFAIKYGIDNTDWNVPLYIHDGLCWLAACDTLAPEKNIQTSSDKEIV